MNRRIAIALGLLCLLVAGADARRFRTIQIIPAPTAAPLPRTLYPVIEDPGLPALSNADTRRAAEDIINAWNGPDFGTYLDSSFQDRTALLRVIDENVPDNAQLRLLGLSGEQILSSTIHRRPDGTVLRISMLSVIAETQVEFTDAGSGYRTLTGRQEMLIRLEEEFGL